MKDYPPRQSTSVKFQVNATTSELPGTISLEVNLSALNTSFSTCKALWVQHLNEGNKNSPVSPPIPNRTTIGRSLFRIRLH